jgi:chorismate mutase
MTEKHKAAMTEDDPKQSEAFRKAVRELEAAGELNPENAERVFDAIIVPKKRGDGERVT